VRWSTRVRSLSQSWKIAVMTSRSCSWRGNHVFHAAHSVYVGCQDGCPIGIESSAPRAMDSRAMDLCDRLCSYCVGYHAAGGDRPMPENHASFRNEMCVNCPAAPSVEETGAAATARAGAPTVPHGVECLAADWTRDPRVARPRISECTPCKKPFVGSHNPARIASCSKNRRERLFSSLLVPVGPFDLFAIAAPVARSTPP